MEKKLQECLVIYQLTDRSQKKTKELTKLNPATIKKYITIVEGLDSTLLENLDKKGKDKLQLNLAEYLVKNIPNMILQREIYPHIMRRKPKERKDIIERAKECMICCDSSINQEQMRCCGKYICENCLMKMIHLDITNVVFTPPKCPFCKEYLSIEYLRYILKDNLRKNKHLWESSLEMEEWRYNEYYSSIHNKNTERGELHWIYLRNLLSYFMEFVRMIENFQGRVVYDNYSDFDYLLKEKEDEPELYFARCNTCSNINIPNFKKKNKWEIELATIEKQCVNGEGNIVVLKPELFKCVVCKSHEENMNDGTFKKCPHCGVKTLKPDGCNYVRCGDHRWCWICEERLEVNHNGHNVHYYTGPGTSAYSDRCRESMNYDITKERYILDSCDCPSCSPFGGAPLCRELECMNRTIRVENGGYKYYCQDCNNTEIGREIRNN